jgi:diaminopimelate epimerase
MATMGDRLRTNQFVKSHALGNDYIVLEEAQLSQPLTPAAVRVICDTHFGIGSDGILLLTPGTRADFGLRIFNPDGSEAEKSGNGLRILAKFLYDHGYTSAPDLTISTPGGTVQARLQLTRGAVAGITVDMGRATFVSTEIPMAGPKREVVKELLEVGNRHFTITAVSVGNPHCVIFTEALDEEEIRRHGPDIEHHPVFPNRVNVQFAQVLSRDRISILIWERGAGYTLASGSSSCAVAAAGLKNGLTDRQVTIQSPGGELAIRIHENWALTLTGPASEICEGSLSQDLLRSLPR